MKRIKLSDTKWFMLLLLMCVPIISSCSKEDLPAYEEAEITKVGAYHRFYSGDKDAITGENIVAEKELDRTNNIDSEHGVATAVFTIPAAGAKFTEAMYLPPPASPHWTVHPNSVFLPIGPGSINTA